MNLYNSLLKLHLTKQNTTFRKAVGPEERLVVCLRYVYCNMEKKKNMKLENSVASRWGSVVSSLVSSFARLDVANMFKSVCSVVSTAWISICGEVLVLVYAIVLVFTILGKQMSLVINIFRESGIAVIFSEDLGWVFALDHHWTEDVIANEGSLSTLAVAKFSSNLLKLVLLLFWKLLNRSWFILNLSLFSNCLWF